jgi:hypothetical protein
MFLNWHPTHITHEIEQTSIGKDERSKGVVLRWEVEFLTQGSQNLVIDEWEIGIHALRLL